MAKPTQHLKQPRGLDVAEIAASPPSERHRSSAASPAFWGLAVLLVLVSLSAFWPVLGNGFVDIDDEDGLVKNPHLLEPAGDLIRWASTSHLQGVYQPLSRMMYGLEAWLWGMDPAGFHAASLALHASYTIALFALTVGLIRLARPSEARERPGLLLGLAALSVGLFSAHPLRAEVVAWASVQAYEPSALCAILSTLAYLRANAASAARRVAWLAISILLFALSLGFYAITLCLPLAFLVLDVYPLRRIEANRWRNRSTLVILLEKSPFFALSLVFAFLTYRARLEMGTEASATEGGFVPRIAATCYGACFYLARTLLPTGLGPIHPVPDRVGLTEPAFALSALAFVAISIAAYRLRRQWPALGAAWLGYLLLQLPSSGLVRFASTIAADRYSYITMIGGPALLAGALRVLLGDQPRRRSLALVAIAGGTATLACIGLSRAECSAWRSSASIWMHVAESHGRPEGFFESRIGRALVLEGKLDEAQIHLEQAVKLSPGLGYAHAKLGLVLVEKGQVAQAYPHFAEAVRLEPGHVEARLNLAYALVQGGRPDQAVVHLAEAVRLKPELPEARTNLGAVLVQLGRCAEAETHLAEALRLAPDRPSSRMDLAYALAQQGKDQQAVDLYAEEVRLRPDDPNARHNLAAVLERLGRRDEARSHAQEARRLATALAVGTTR